MARHGLRLLGATIVFAIVAVAWKTALSPTRPRTRFFGQNTFENTRAGDRSRYTILESAKDTKGAYFRFKELARAGCPGFTPGRSGSPPFHIHNYQEECFKIDSGSFGYILDGVEGRLKPGEGQLCIPPGKPHQFWNADNSTDMDFEITLTPAGTFEPFIRTYAGLASDAGSIENVNPLQIFVMFPYGGMQLAEMPRLVWLIIERLVVPLCQLLNIYQPTYPEYTG